MGESTKIQWTDHTWNAWRGCSKVSPGCDNCYAEAMSFRNPAVLGEWGPKGRRAIAAEPYWQLPFKWNRAAEKAGVRRRVFCLSLGDIFEDRPELDEPRQRVFDTILATPWLDWLLLTKRPEVARDWLTSKVLGGLRNAHEWGRGWENVWLGTSVEDQQRAKERIPVLLSIPAAIHWISAEPLLGPLDLGDYTHFYHGNQRPAKKWEHGKLDWIVLGGESGGGSRSCHVEWIRDVVKECRGLMPGTGTAVFVKQLGNLAVTEDRAAAPEQPANRTFSEARRIAFGGFPLELRDKKGGDITEFPADLQVREFPTQTFRRI